MQKSKPSTVGDALNWAAEQFENAKLFYGHGTDNAWDEAVALVLYVLQLPINTGREIMETKLSQQQQEKIHNLVHKRIKERKPVAYLTQQTWFAGLQFYVDERVIIPRSPMAELIQHRFSPWIKSEKVGRILDLCTGSGCIAIACAAEFPAAQVDAVDISDDALAVALINVKQHGLAERVHLIKSDLFAELNGRKYDVIISNPPYVSDAEMAALPLEYQHEPKLALAAGTKGLDLAIRILQTAEKYLTENGILIIEVGNSEKALRRCFPKIPFTWLEFEHGDGGVFLLTRDQLNL